MKNKSILVLVVSALMLTIAGCNTTAGIGRDMSSVGNAVENTAEDAKN
jgi:predicted small secreted protein